MARSLLRWTRDLRAAVRRRTGGRPGRRSLEREIASGVLNELRCVAYRCKSGPDGPVQFISESVNDLTGYPAEDFRNGRVSLRSILGARDAAARSRGAARAVLERRRFDLQYPIRTADGEDRRLREQGCGIYSDGDVLAVDGLITDVTESRRPLGEELFDVLVQWISDYAIFTLDPEGRVATWNRGARRILGYAPEQIIGRHFADFAPKPDGLGIALLEEAARTGSASMRGWLQSEGGARFWATVVITPIREKRALTGFAMIVRDLGGSAGGDSVTRLHQLADEVPAFVWVADADGKTAYVNAQWTDYTGQTLADTHGEGWIRFIHPEDVARARAFWSEAVTDKKLREAELRIRGADGAYRWFLTRGSPILDAQGLVVAFFGTSVDIDENVSRWRQDHERAEGLESEVNERTKRLQETVEELESFSYTASHDLRAPLRSIAGHAQMLLRDLGEKLDAGAQAHLQRMSESAARLDRLIHDLVVYSSIGRITAPPESVDLDVLVPELVQRLLPGAESSVRLPLGRVVGQRSLLSHAIGHVLDNAYKFVKSGERPSVKIWSEKSEGKVRISIEDNGIGIAGPSIEKAFRPFERVHGADYPGTGIGLAIVKKSVARMGGSVGLESDFGSGSRFWIELPAG